MSLFYLSAEINALIQHYPLTSQFAEDLCDKADFVEGMSSIQISTLSLA
jgi:hypothetical protein